MLSSYKPAFLVPSGANVNEDVYDPSTKPSGGLILDSMRPRIDKQSKLPTNSEILIMLRSYKLAFLVSSGANVNGDVYDPGNQANPGNSPERA